MTLKVRIHGEKKIESNRRFPKNNLHNFFSFIDMTLMTSSMLLVFANLPKFKTYF